MGTLEAFDPEQPLEVSCRKFAEFLGLDAPVSAAVLLGAVADSAYAHNLIVSRTAPEFLNYLLQHPPVPGGGERQTEPESVAAVVPSVVAEQPQAEPAELSNIDLMKKAATAVWKWSKSGFAEVDDDMYKKRLAACAACEHLKDPPSKMLYKLATANSVDRKICGMCGCVVTNKAKIPTERCPAVHASDPSLNGWGEPVGGRQPAYA